MTQPGSGDGGFLLSLLIDSFAVRALLGSVVASLIAGVAVGFRLVRRRRARRVVVLAPVVATVVAAAATAVTAAPGQAGDAAWLPVLEVQAVAPRVSAQTVEILGRQLDVRAIGALAAVWAVVATAFLGRRIIGLVSARRLLRRATPLPLGHPLETDAAALAVRMDLRRVRILLLADCPGGAFTTGSRHPVVVLDPNVLASLDGRETEGLLAHEFAHVRRRDPLVGVLAGVVADLAFFLPTVHLVRRWLYHEQEESADELASSRTCRPGALASSILKVFQGSGTVAPPRGACAAVPLVAHGPAAATRWRRPDPVRIIAGRVGRLVEPPAALTRNGARVELGLLALLTAATVVAAGIAPTLLAERVRSLSFGYVPAPVEEVEAPAFSTFRALTSEDLPRAAVDERGLRTGLADVSGAEAPATCPCIESQAQLAAGTPAAPDGSAMAWREDGASSVALAEAEAHSDAPLLGEEANNGYVGLFVLEARQ